MQTPSVIGSSDATRRQRPGWNNNTGSLLHHGLAGATQARADMKIATWDWAQPKRPHQRRPFGRRSAFDFNNHCLAADAPPHINEWGKKLAVASRCSRQEDPNVNDIAQVITVLSIPASENVSPHLGVRAGGLIDDLKILTIDNLIPARPVLLPSIAVVSPPKFLQIHNLF